MKLDTKAFRYLSPEDWRVLTAVEIGTKNHVIVPTPLIASLSSLRGGANGANRSISVLAKAGLIARVKNAKYDGYRLTYGGLDYLALHAHTKSGAIIHLGSQMGTGKESDIYLVTSPAPALENTDEYRSSSTIGGSGSGTGTVKPGQSILKLHRLGRISFRSLTRNRDYHGGRQHASWQYLSRLSAQKEFAAMKALYEAGFPVPRPIAWNRHTVVMSLIPGLPLRQVGIEAFESAEQRGSDDDYVDDETQEQERSDDQEIHKATEEIKREDRDRRISDLYSACMEMALRLAEFGCIHGDFNEFNILIENVPDTMEGSNGGARETVPNSEAIPSEAIPSNPQHPDPLSTSDTTLNPELGTNSPKSKTTGNPKPLIPHLIDFPQITSLSHPQARSYFDRDITCIKRFFLKKYNFTSSDNGPTFEDALERLKQGEKRRASAEYNNEEEGSRGKRLDVHISAMGFSKKMARELELYFAESLDGDDERREVDGYDDEEEDEEFRNVIQADHTETENETAMHISTATSPPPMNTTQNGNGKGEGKGNGLELTFENLMQSDRHHLNSDFLIADRLDVDAIVSRDGDIGIAPQVENASQGGRVPAIGKYRSMAKARPKAVAGWSI